MMEQRKDYDVLLRVYHSGRQMALLETALKCIDELGRQDFAKPETVDLAKCHLQALHTQCERSISKWGREARRLAGQVSEDTL